MRRNIYLDSNASHPLLASVGEGLSAAILESHPGLSNPASIHWRGQQAKKSMAELRDLLCQILGRGDGDEFVFGSGATEALNLALRGFCADRLSKNRKPLLVTSSVEHPAVLDTCKDLQVETLIVPVDSEGQLNASHLYQLLNSKLESPENDVLLILQLANNETGLGFDFDELAEKVFIPLAPKPLVLKQQPKRGTRTLEPQRLFLALDGAQALGKLDEAVIRKALHYADYMALSSHKIGGPPGFGALWIRGDAPLKSQITGGKQERRRRAGTFNSLGAYGFYLALLDWKQHGAVYRKKMSELQKLLLDGIRRIPGAKVHGTKPVLPNTINFHVEGCPEESLLLALDLEGVQLSSGSACNSGSLNPSHVLMAMGYSDEEALSSLRVCLGVENTQEEVEEFLKLLAQKVAHIRSARELSEKLLAQGQLHI